MAIRGILQGVLRGTEDLPDGRLEELFKDRPELLPGTGLAALRFTHVECPLVVARWTDSDFQGVVRDPLHLLLRERVFFRGWESEDLLQSLQNAMKENQRSLGRR